SSGTASPDNPFTPFTEPTGLEVVGKAKRGATGTRVRYWSDPQIFLPDAQFQYTELADRARQTAFLIPGLGSTVTDERGIVRDEAGEVIETRTEEFRYEGGISEFVDHLAGDPGLTDVWRFSGQGTFTETVPVLDDDGRMVSTDVTRDVGVDVAVRWGSGFETRVKSFVNIIATPKGGTHVAGFEQALLKTVRKAVDANARKLKVGKDKL